MRTDHIGTEAYSITTFCAAHNISRALFYILEQRGEAPRTMYVGRRRLISKEAAAEWRRERERASSEAAA